MNTQGTWGKSNYIYKAPQVCKPTKEEQEVIDLLTKDKAVGYLKLCLTKDTETIFDTFKDSVVGEKKYEDEPRKDGILYFEDNRYALIKGKANANVLLTVHLDTVQKLPELADIKVTNTRIKSSCLDDRLGLWLALYVLPTYLDVPFDLLLTNYEETGDSTAQYVPKELLDRYNWVVGLDRAGDDVVTYDLDSPEWLKSIKEAGLYKSWGSFSDVCYLDTDRCCMNLGIGYHKAHASDSYCVLKELASNLIKFKKFCTDQSDIPYVRTTKAGRKDKKEKTTEYSSYDGWYTNDCGFCGDYVYRGSKYDNALGLWLCPVCYAMRHKNEIF